MREAAIARALVDAETLRLTREITPPLSRVTAGAIVDKYGLDWGEYSTPRGSGSEQEHRYGRAGHLVRIALGNAWRDGRLARLRRLADGKPVRDGKQFVYVCPFVTNPVDTYGTGVELWQYGEEWKPRQANDEAWSAWLRAIGMHSA